MRAALGTLLLCLWGLALAQPPVVSTTPVDATTFNRRILVAAEAGAIWPRDPLLVTREFIGELRGRDLSFEKREGPGGSVIVTAIRDGLGDARLAGDWVELRLSSRWREPAGGVPHQLWLVDTGRRAWRCRRGELNAVFAAQPCP